MKNVTKQIQKIPLLVFLALFCSMTVMAQQFTARGVVVDNNGDPVIGASVVLKSQTTTGTITDADGNFALNVPEEKGTGNAWSPVKTTRSGLYFSIAFLMNSIIP